MRLFSTLILTLLLCVSLSLTLTARADTPYHDYHGISETQLPLTGGLHFDHLEVGNGDTLYATHVGPPRRVYRSLDDGQTWTVVKEFTRTCAGFMGLFIDDNGSVYIGLIPTGKVHRGLVDGDSLAFTDVLTMECSTGMASWWNMAQSDAGSLFVGNYAGTTDEHCAAIYRSSTGAHWTEVYYTPNLNRHIHEVGVDPWSDDVYASIGDTPLAVARIVKSGDNGATWDTVRVGTCLCKPVSLTFTPTRRLWGSDVGAAGSAQDSTNVIEWTNDDSAYTQGLRLEGAENCLVWSMETNDARTIFAGAMGRATDGPGRDIRMYASWDSGSHWYTVKEFGVDAAWAGVSHISRKADPDGYSYYCVTQDDGSGYDAFRFTDVSIWTVGSGGDFATIALALDDFRVGAADTLVLLAGSHEVNADALLANMTIRGATRDPSLYLVKNAAVNADGFTCAVAGAALRNMTLRTVAGQFTTTGKAMVKVTDGGQLTLERCEFRNCDGYSAPCVYLDGDGAGTTNLTMIDCVADSCSGDTVLSSTAGVIFATHCDALTIDGLVASNNWSRDDGGVLRTAYQEGALLVKNSLFVDNRAYDDGAAIHVHGSAGSSAKVWHCTFDGNETANAVKGQVKLQQVSPVNVISHCIFANSDSTYALCSTAYVDSIRHCDSWNTGNDNFNWNSPACTDTLHVAPDYNCLNVTTDCYRANAPELETCADGSFMGWLRGIQRRGRPIALGVRGRRGRR